MFICSLENSLIRFLICVESLGLKVCGILSINRIFRLEWEFLKSTGRLFVSVSAFFWTQVVFCVTNVTSLLCGDGRFVFWSADATDWFDEE